MSGPASERFLGTALSPAYRVDRVLGRGGMGIVLEAEQVDLARRVAIKVLLDADDDLIARFRQEARVLAAIDHPNVVRVHGFERARDGTPFIVMALVPGTPLRDVLLRERRLSPERAVRITRQVLSALAAVHAVGVVHRDVKPANILLSDQDHVTLVDFGVAKDARGVQTTGDRILGTPAYLAPEQVFGRNVGPPTDVHAVGICLFEMLVGSRPWPSGGIEVLMQRLDPATDIRSVDPNVPEALAAVVMQALRGEPAERPTVASMRAALEAWLHSTRPPSRRRVRLAATLLTLLCGVGFASGVLLWRARRPSGTPMAAAMPEGGGATTAASHDVPPAVEPEPLAIAVVDAGILLAADASPAVFTKATARLCFCGEDSLRPRALCVRPRPVSCVCEPKIPVGSLCPVPTDASRNCPPPHAYPPGPEGAPCRGYPAPWADEPATPLDGVLKCSACYGEPQRMAGPTPGAACTGIVPHSVTSATGHWRCDP